MLLTVVIASCSNAHLLNAKADKKFNLQSKLVRGEFTSPCQLSLGKSSTNPVACPGQSRSASVSASDQSRRYKAPPLCDNWPTDMRKSLIDFEVSESKCGEI
jgi:hypothetical protein